MAVVSRLAAFVFAFLLVAGAAAAENLSPRAFTDAFAASVRATIPGAKVTVTGDLQTETRDGIGKATVSDLRNAYALYLQNPERLVALLRDYVGVLAETMHVADAKAPDRSRIVPVLKSQRWVDELRRARGGQTADAAPEVLTEPFNSELAIVYAEDQASSMRFLTTRDDVGDRARLRNLALGNLNRLLPKIQMRPGADGVSLITADGVYDASLLLADALWSSGQIEVEGDIVVAAPAKGPLLVTGSRNRAGIARLRALAAELAAGPYGLTPALFVWRGGKFVVFDGK
jgi:uncharacterized protein YtpQ (UPF0354 family)